MSQNHHSRVIQTRVIESGQILELSLVDFTANTAQTFSTIHEQVVLGVSMGKAFRENNVQFTRRPRSTAKISRHSLFNTAFCSDNNSTAVFVDIYVGSRDSHYCSILEIYSGEVNWPGAVNSAPTRLEAEKIEKFSELLAEMKDTPA